MTMADVVDDALDRYCTQMARRGIDPGGVQAHTLAALAGVNTGYMSTCLQVHRQKQGTGATRYVLAAEQYGPMARWRILAKPGSDPAVVRDARRQHGVWIVRDAFNRYVSDRVHELRPSLSGSAQDQLIENLSQLTQQHFEADLNFIDTQLSAPIPAPAARRGP